MALTQINHNIAAMNAQRNLSLNTDRIGKSMEALSSGLRINRAADDPAGLVMSESLRVQISGLDVVQQNVSQGVNLIKTAEGALTETNSLLRQINDLALNSASVSTNTADTRAAMQAQVNSALTSINQIANNTKYAGLKLLDGSAGTSATILDTTNIASAQLTSSAPAGYMNITVNTAATKALHTGGVNYAGGTTDTVQAGSVTINNISIGTFTATNTVADVITAINGKATQTGVQADVALTGGKIMLRQQSYGSDQGAIVVETGAGTGIINTAKATSADFGIDEVATINATLYNQGKGLQLKDAAGDTINLKVATAPGALNSAMYVTQGQVSFQTGLTSSETASTSIASMTASALGISGIDVSTVAGAQSAMTAIATAINTVSNLRGAMGAFQSNQLEAQGRSLATTRENLAASESAIRDTDFGKQMAEYSTSQILVQSATAFLAQANSLPQNVLTLIRGG